MAGQVFVLESGEKSAAYLPSAIGAQFEKNTIRV
jgi:hypothetical protein